MAKPKQRVTTSPKRELPKDPDALLTKQEVAQYLGVTLHWVEKRAIPLNYFPHIKVGKLIRVRLSDLLAYIEANHSAKAG
ncbi:MAG: helix-turn-helix domain-containing protein [Gaiellaceae bacterium]